MLIMKAPVRYSLTLFFTTAFCVLLLQGYRERPSTQGSNAQDVENRHPHKAGSDSQVKVTDNLYSRYPVSHYENHRIESRIKFSNGSIQASMADWKSQIFCDINCTSGVPCEYKDEVDFRVILIVANRPASLSKCMSKISKIDMLNDRISVDIWIDMLKDGTIHEETQKVAETFTRTFTLGRACYHAQDKHSFIANQWINTYRPKVGTKEVAMILEDDIDVSPHVWRWYKALHRHFRSANNIAGYSLKMKDANLRAVGKTGVPIRGPINHSVVLYNCFQAWGYSPQPSAWRDFQDWYYMVRVNKYKGDIVTKTDLLDPRVPGSIHYSWWKTFKKKNFQESMAHEMWNIYYTNIYYKMKYNKPLYTVYSNLHVFTNRTDVQLCVNRKEKGLHYSGKSQDINESSQLLTNWKPEYIKFPTEPHKLSIIGYRVI